MADYIPVLTFHALDTQNSVISFSPRLFARSMERLWRNGYRSVRLCEAAGLVSDRKPFPDKSFVLTFDDGYRSVYDEAFPVLRKYGYTATVFLITGGAESYTPQDRLAPYGGRETLSWGEIKEMSKDGIDFGAHTLTHPDLSSIDASRIEYEMRESKEIIENNLGAPVLSFAYPYGKYNARSMEAAGRYFKCACSDELGLLTNGSSLYAVERVDAYYLRQESLFGLMLTKSFPLYLFLRNIPRTIARRLGGR
ncbi:MAG TPA: polysaccharide deacetylase family protein [Thermodesulfobacteriota bacterium]|nr:polysaccharide deacetylase family protein [Thermodesulfobacteriota bacterium]